MKCFVALFIGAVLITNNTRESEHQERITTFRDLFTQ